MEVAEFDYLNRQGHFHQEAEENKSKADGAVKPSTSNRKIRGTSKDGFTDRNV